MTARVSLSEMVAEVEATDPEVRAAVESYDRSVASIIDRLRAHAAMEDASRRPEPRPDARPVDAPELSLADLCGYCGTDPSTTTPCGVECAGCGGPVKVAPHTLADEVAAREAWAHVHGEGCEDPRPVKQGVAS